MNHYLSILLFEPLLGALLLVLVNKRNENAIRWIANITVFVGFVISIPLWFVFDPQGRLRLYMSYGLGPDVFVHDIRELLRSTPK